MVLSSSLRSVLLKWQQWCKTFLSLLEEIPKALVVLWNAISPRVSTWLYTSFNPSLFHIWKLSLPPKRDALINKGYVYISDSTGHSAEHVRGTRCAWLLTGLLHFWSPVNHEYPKYGSLTQPLKRTFGAWGMLKLRGLMLFLHYL